MISDTGALVLFSGGQDSTTCLAWALERFEQVETVGFDYGQRHRVEFEYRNGIRRRLATCFPQWTARLGEDHLLDVPVLTALGSTALSSEMAIALDSSGLPNTFVPGRNLVFLTLAAALAYRRATTVLVGGMCETDFSGYPDYRDNTIRGLEGSLSLGMAQSFRIETPLMWLDKAATWQLAFDLGGEALVDVIQELTHTFYLGDRRTRAAWGYGCGTCPAYELRARGHAEWMERAA